MKKLEEKTVLVMGGTRGIGLATAKRFVAEGAADMKMESTNRHAATSCALVRP